MMKEILEIISRGGNLDVISREIGVEKELIIQRLDELVKRGYLSKVEMNSSCGTSKCADCPMNRSCTRDEVFPRIFEMTPKGKRILDRNTL